MALHQLVYLSRRRTEEARQLLALFNDPACYLPFAATAINFTQFVLGLLYDGLLDDRLYGKRTFNRDGKSSIDAAMDELHDVFCDLFLRFGENVWRLQRPPAGGIGAMAFPPLFDEFREQTRQDITLLVAGHQ